MPGVGTFLTEQFSRGDPAGWAAGALAVLGSATPSLESYHNAAAGKYTRITLGRRVLDRPLADVRLVTMRDEYAAEGPDVVVSRTLADGIENRLSRGEQVVVLLNRRGYARALICRQCGTERLWDEPHGFDCQEAMTEQAKAEGGCEQCLR